MTINIQRGRQFLAGETTTRLFEKNGKAGTWLDKAADKLVAQGHTLSLRRNAKKGDNFDVTLKTAEDWKAFLSEHAGKKSDTKRFADTFGISFTDFANVVDDLAASNEKGLTLRLTNRSDLGRALSLNLADDDYASRLTPGTELKLSGEDGAKATARLVASSASAKDIWK